MTVLTPALTHSASAHRVWPGLRLAVALGLAAALASCGVTSASKVTDAATAPLSDLNLVHADIPEVLRTAQQAPYAVPPDHTCAGLMAAVKSLDAVLGADLDAPASDKNPSLIERGGDEATNALQRTAEGLVPFRGWVRKLSGAERYSRQVAAAIAAGTVRRAFLKGMAQAQGCKPT